MGRVTPRGRRRTTDARGARIARRRTTAPTNEPWSVVPPTPPSGLGPWRPRAARDEARKAAAAAAAAEGAFEFEFEFK